MTIAKGEQIAAWVQLARGGDRTAFGCLVRQFQDAVAGVVLARTGRGADVEDITQDVFVAAWQQLDQLREPGGFGSWVCGIARNLALRWQRDRRKPAALPEDVAAPQGEASVDLADRVMAAVQDLPERLREPLTLFYINGYSTEDVAGLLEIPAGTVRRRLHEARHHLKEHMESLMEDEIKKNAPPDNLAETILDRITDVRVQPDMPSPGMYLIHIKDQEARTFPIVVGKREGEALQEGLGQLPPPSRPQLYDMMLKAAGHFGIALRAVRITELKDHTFYARILAASPAGTIDLDARPSDAINLAVRAGIAMQVVRSITEKCVVDPGKLHPSASRWMGPTPEHLDDLRRQLAANPVDLSTRLDLASKLALVHTVRAFKRPWPLPVEQMVREAAEHLAEARTLLGEVLQQAKDPQQRRDAAIWLGSVEYLEGRWPEAVAAFEQYDGVWSDLEWPASLHFATALHRAGRSDESLARLADAVAAIDRMHGTSPLTAGRLVAREALARVVGRAMPSLLSDPRLRRAFEPLDPPCLVVPWFGGLPLHFGPAYLLEDRGLVIGSAAEVDVQVTDEKVSPRHARVYREAEGWKVEDLGSAEGTWVKGQRLDQPTKIESGVLIHLHRGPQRVLLLDLAQRLDGPAPAQAEQAIFVHLVDQQPFDFPVPLAQNFGKEDSPPAIARTLIEPAGRGADASWPIAQLPPDLPDCPVPWLAHKLRFTMDEGVARLTLIGPEGQEALFEGPAARHGSAGGILSRASLLRPMAEQLAANFLAAGQMTCPDVLLAPPDAAGQRTARVHLRREDREVWLDADPIDAITMASAMSPSPAIWVCEAE